MVRKAPMKKIPWFSLLFTSSQTEQTKERSGLQFPPTGRKQAHPLLCYGINSFPFQVQLYWDTGWWMLVKRALPALSQAVRAGLAARPHPDPGYLPQDWPEPHTVAGPTTTTSSTTPTTAYSLTAAPAPLKLLVLFSIGPFLVFLHPTCQTSWNDKDAKLSFVQVCTLTLYSTSTWQSQQGGKGWRGKVCSSSSHSPLQYCHFPCHF